MAVKKGTQAHQCIETKRPQHELALFSAMKASTAVAIVNGLQGKERTGKMCTLKRGWCVHE